MWYIKHLFSKCGCWGQETQQFEGENTGHVENGYVWDLNTSIKTLAKTGGGTSPKLAFVMVDGFSLLDHIRFVI